MWIPDSLPHLLKAPRKERHLTQTDLARRSQVRQQAISQLDCGQTRGSVETLVALCDGLDLSDADVIRRLEWSPDQAGRPDRTLARRHLELTRPLSQKLRAAVWP